MRRFFLISILISTFLLGCVEYNVIETPSAIPTVMTISNDDIRNTPTLTLVDNAELVQIIPQAYMEHVSRNPALISSSGEKIIIDNNPIMGMYYKEEKLFSLNLVQKEQVSNLEIQLDTPSTFYSVSAWAPDERAFAAIFIKRESFNGSDNCCGEAIAITDLNDGNSKTFTYHWGWNHTTRLLWSEDSSKVIADFLGDHTPLVFNRNSELIKAFPQDSSPLFWSKDILYLAEKKDEVVQLYSYDFNSQESNLIMDDIIGYSYISHNHQKNQILMTKYESAQIDTYEQINKFYIVDINQKSVEEALLPEAREVWSFHWAISPNQDFVALKGRDNSMWIFNWTTYTFKYYGQIEDLFGWFKNTNGFLVTSLNSEQKIVKP